MSEKTQYNLKLRFKVFAGIFGVLVVLLLIRYGNLMLASENSGTGAGSESAAIRGHILDRNGRILAMTAQKGDVTLWRDHMEDPVLLSLQLAPLIGRPASYIQDRINNTRGPSVVIDWQIDNDIQERIEAARTEGIIKGISVSPVYGRIYPEGALAAQLIGGVNNVGVGLGGIEHAFAHELLSVSGGIIPGSGGRRSGNNIYLTLDINVQYMLENIAYETLVSTQAESVMCMAMDPRTGDVLALASLPGFDPNNFRASTAETRINKPAIWAFEPGSVFKVFSISALMDSGAINSNSSFFCNGYYERITPGGTRITIRCLESHGRVSPREIIAYSCNAGAAYASDQIGSNDFYRILREFGFGSRTPSGIPGETSGILRTPDNWWEPSKPTISMGQEVSVSAMQMLQAASIIANDGVLVPPRVILKIDSPDGNTSKEYNMGHARRVIKPETSRAMLRFMTDAASNIGTGWRAYMGDVSMAIKTGTSQVIDPQTGIYSDTDFIASSLALLPAESPSLVLYIAIFNPRGEIWGGRIAAPAIREMAEELVNYLGIPRRRNYQFVHSGEFSIPPVSSPEITGIIPDFTGLSKQQLFPLTLNNDLKINISGEGWVISQSPPPGTPYNRDTFIILELE